MNECVGRGVSWLVLVMVLIGSFNAIARYLGRFIGLHLSSNAYLELQWYLFSLIFLLGAAYTFKQGAHVRVDVLVERLKPRTQTGINLGGALLFLLPFCVFMIWASWSPAKNSWAIMEQSPDPGGLPRYPIKTVLPLAFLLLMLQGLSQVFKDIMALGHGVSAKGTEDTERK